MAHANGVGTRVELALTAKTEAETAYRVSIRATSARGRSVNVHCPEHQE